MGEPGLGRLRALLSALPPYNPGASPGAWRQAVGGAIDLSVSTQRDQLRQWLNKWGCRLKYPPPDGPDLFSDELV
jgi:hypothetical protein